MRHRVRRTTLFVLYQTSVVLGILLLPIALVMARAGVPLPINRVVDSLGDAYEATGPEAGA